MDADEQGYVVGQSAYGEWQPAGVRCDISQPGRNRLRLALSYQTAESRETVQARAGRYVECLGYRQVDAAHYRRGSRWGSWTSLTPRGLQAVVTIEVASAGNGCDVRAYFDVNTTGQTVLPAEVEFWQAEAEGLAEAVRSGRAGADMSVAYERRARHAGLKYALVVLVGALVTSLVAAGLRAASDRWLPAVWNPVVVYAGRNPIAWVFIILAVVAFAAVFIWWRRRRQ